MSYNDLVMSDLAPNPRADLGLRLPFESREQEVFLNLLRTCDALAGEFQLLFREHGLSQPLYNVLRIVAGAGEDGVRTQAIGQQMVTREPDVTRLVDRLEKAGWVQRQRCREDRRVVWVKITAAGTETLGEIADPVRRLHQGQLGHLTASQLDHLSELLSLARRSPEG